MKHKASAGWGSAIQFSENSVQNPFRKFGAEIRREFWREKRREKQSENFKCQKHFKHWKFVSKKSRQNPPKNSPKNPPKNSPKNPPTKSADKSAEQIRLKIRHEIRRKIHGGIHGLKPRSFARGNLLVQSSFGYVEILQNFLNTFKIDENR